MARGIAQGRRAPAPESAQSFVPPETGISLARTVRADKPTGTVAITGARILTMTGDQAGVIENG